MATHVTGRIRTVNLYQPTAGWVRVWSRKPLPHLPYQRFWAQSEVRLETNLGTLHLYGIIEQAGTIYKLGEQPGAPGNGDKIGIRAAINDDFPFRTVADSAWETISDGCTINQSIAGSLSIAADVEEYEDHGLISASLIDVDGFPNYGSSPPGTAQKDGPQAEYCHRHERTRIGGTYSIIASCSGATATESGSYVANTTLNYEVLRKVVATSYRWDDAAFTVFAQMDDIDFLNASLPGGEDYTETSTGRDCYVSIGGKDLEVGVLGLGEGVQALCETKMTPLTVYDLEARIRCFDQPYSAGGISLQWIDKASHQKEALVGNPQYREVFRQQDHYWFAVLDGELRNGPTVTELTPIRAWLSNASLASLGEDQRDWRTLMRGRRYHAFTLIQAASLTLDSGGSTTDWAAGANTTVGSSGGEVTLTVAGGAGSATRTWSTRKWWTSYRYLRIRARADANRTITIQAGSKTWSIDVTNSVQNIDIDLCSPHNAVVSTDTQQSHWPVDGSGYPTTENELWGVNNPATLVVTGIPDGATIYLDSISLVRRDHAKTSWLVPFQTWLTKNAALDELQRFLWLDFDGRKGFAPHHSWRTSGGVYNFRTLGDVRTELAAFDGLTCLLASPWADSFYTDARPAYWLHSGQHGGTDWAEDVGASMVPSGAIHAQACWDQIQGYPGCGEWDLSPYVDLTDPDWEEAAACPMRITKFMRGCGYGLAFRTSDAEPLEGANVQATQVSDSTVVGNGLTSSIGQYQTGAPWARGDRLIRSTLQVPTPLSADLTWQDRQLARVSFRGAVAAQGRHLCHDRQHGRTFGVSFGEGAIWGRQWSSNGAIDDFEILSVSATDAQVAWHPTGRLLVFYAASGTGYLIDSGADGVWSAPVSLGSCTRIAGATCPRTGAVAAALYSGGVWTLKYKAKLSESFVAAGTIVASGAAEVAAGLEFLGGADQGLRLFWTDSGGQGRSYITKNLTTWEEES